MKLTKVEKGFSILNNFALAFLSFISLAPFVHVVAKSFSSPQAIMSGEVSFWPVDWTLGAYSEVIKDHAFNESFMISVERTIIGTLVSVFFTCLLAYPLSKSYIKGRNLIVLLIVFTMMFSGGMIPTFLTVKYLGLLNSFWAYIIPGAISAFNVVLMKNFFQSVSVELEESARIDGCSNLGTFFRIVIPLSMPAIATIALFHAVDQWNAFFDATLYINDSHLYPLQVYLRELIQLNQTNMQLKDKLMITTESLKAAALVASTVPILIVYPFLQKYFVKGLMLGSVKG